MRLFRRRELLSVDKRPTNARQAVVRTKLNPTPTQGSKMDAKRLKARFNSYDPLSRSADGAMDQPKRSASALRRSNSYESWALSLPCQQQVTRSSPQLALRREKMKSPAQNISDVIDNSQSGRSVRIFFENHPQMLCSSFDVDHVEDLWRHLHRPIRISRASSPIASWSPWMTSQTVMQNLSVSITLSK